MFLNKKKVLLGILFCSTSSITIAQDSISDNRNMVSNYKTLLLNGSHSYLPIYKIKPEVPLSTEKEFKQEDYSAVYTNNWNNKVFDAFHNKKVKTPFALHFKDQKFASPVEHKMVVTSRYGWRNGRAHRGIDIDLQTGDKVKALLAGKVRYVSQYSGYGKTIIIRHDNGLETVYAHLSEYLIKENDVVEKGQIIGKGGDSGNARGSHLHLEVKYQGKSIHPEYFFDFSEETSIRSENIVVTNKWMTPRSHTSTKKSTIVVQTNIKKAQNQIFKEEKDPLKSIYIVKKGDTLYGIARKHRIKVSEICKINEIRNSTVLNIGQKIMIY